MIPLIQQAMTLGYGASMILNFLKGKVPGLDQGIDSARKRGYKDEDLLKFLQGKLGGGKNLPKSDTTPMDRYYSLGGLKTKQEREADKARNIKGALGVAGTAMGLYGAARGLGSVATKAGGALESMLGASSAPPGAPAEVLKSVGPELSKGATAAATVEETAPNFMEMLKSSGIDKKVSNLLNAGNAPDIVSGVIEKVTPKNIVSAYPNFREKISEYIKGLPGKESEKMEEVVKESPKGLQVGSSVMLKDGSIGTIENMPGNTSKIDIGGKKVVDRTENLIEMPIGTKDLDELYSDLIKGIEDKTGSEVSRNVYFAGYDPNTRELVYKPHDGALYVYDNISESDANQLTSILGRRKTTGSNYIGSWTEGGSSPIGAEMYKLIRRLQDERGGKGKEYKNKFLTIYDALEPAKIAARKKYEERKKKRKT